MHEGKVDLILMRVGLMLEEVAGSPTHGVGGIGVQCNMACVCLVCGYIKLLHCGHYLDRVSPSTHHLV